MTDTEHSPLPPPYGQNVAHIVEAVMPKLDSNIRDWQATQVLTELERLGWQLCPPGEPMTGDRRIRGYCPWGCGESLFIAAGGFVTCSNPACDRPTGLSDILADPETEHVVQRQSANGYAVQHPIRERVGGKLFRCPLLAHLKTTPSWVEYRIGVPYRVWRDGDTWQWKEVPVR